MKNSTKTLVLVGLATALGAGSVAVVANAEGDSVMGLRGSNSPQERLRHRVAQVVDSEANEGPENETNEGPENEANEGPENEMNDRENEADEGSEMSQYQSLATITPQQAQQTAEAAQGGTATQVELDEEAGSLIYEVEFANAEVIVDAGNGKILKTEVEGQEENDATEAPIQGSIQVPDSDGGDEEEAQR